MGFSVGPIEFSCSPWTGFSSNFFQFLTTMVLYKTSAPEGPKLRNFVVHREHLFSIGPSFVKLLFIVRFSDGHPPFYRVPALITGHPPSSPGICHHHRAPAIITGHPPSSPGTLHFYRAPSIITGHPPFYRALALITGCPPFPSKTRHSHAFICSRLILRIVAVNRFC